MQKPYTFSSRLSNSLNQPRNAGVQAIQNSRAGKMMAKGKLNLAAAMRIDCTTRHEEPERGAG
jgi:hypothetical protein